MTPKDDFNAQKLIKRLKAARDADPNWEKAIQRVVDAEAKYGKHDPAEGKVVILRKPKAPRK